MRFPMMYVQPAKAQTSLRIRAVWSEPLLVAWIFYDCWATAWTSFGVWMLNRRLQRLVWVYTCQMPHCWKSHVTAHLVSHFNQLAKILNLICFLKDANKHLKMSATALLITISLLAAPFSSAANRCKQFGPRSKHSDCNPERIFFWKKSDDNRSMKNYPASEGISCWWQIR